MADAALRAYQGLPPPLRSLVATLRGARLNAWRYGPETERWVEEALARDAWSEARWEAWRAERLSRLLARAATRVPYYREQWAERRRRGDQASFERLADWPVLQKDAIRERPHAFVADDCDPRRMFHAHTSGTTGKPLSLWWRRETLRGWYALMEARLRRWNGVSRRDRWAMIGGQLVTRFDADRPPFWVWNAAMKQLYMSSYHLRPAFLPAYLEAMRGHRVVYALGYASSLHALAATALERGLEAPRLRVALVNAEPLYPYQRESIERAFGGPVRETYGMTEMVCGASECASGALHLWPDAGVLEVLREESDESVPAGREGRLVCTGLLDADMPLIRYEVGDRGSLAPAGTACPCGRVLPILARVEGRLDDVLVTRDGRRIGRLDPVFKGDLHIREAQIVQETLERIRVVFVPAPGYAARHGASIVERLRDRVGDMEIVLDPVDEIPRSANGKFRAVVSHVR